LTASLLRARAPGKVNLCLFLGPLRPDGRHDLVSVVQSVSLADEVEMRAAPDGALGDEVVCAGVDGPNLALAALVAFRDATGWDGPPHRIVIEKRVPVAAGMGGGSADAAAVLRLAAHASGLGSPDLLHDLAADLGSDVPAALEPGRALVTGAGERVARLPAPAAGLGVLVLPAAGELSTADVFAEADRLGLPRSSQDLEERLALVSDHLRIGELSTGLMVNDLEPAARSLHPGVGDALDEARAAGAEHVLVSGSGPTVCGLFLGSDGPERAAHAAESLDGRRPAAVVATLVGAGFGDPWTGQDEKT
jgi:4-diphosphocytidyl-2-C-methyl-D-erythritol kinase